MPGPGLDPRAATDADVIRTAQHINLRRMRYKPPRPDIDLADAVKPSYTNIIDQGSTIFGL